MFNDFAYSFLSVAFNSNENNQKILIMLVLWSFFTLSLDLLYYLVATYFQMVPFTGKRNAAKIVLMNKRATSKKVIFSQSSSKWQEKRGKHTNVSGQALSLSLVDVRSTC